MTLRRFAAIALATFSAILAVLLASPTIASGQAGSATVDVTVRWPDGTLAPDDLCVHFVDEFGIGFFGLSDDLSSAFAQATGPQTSVVAEPGERITVLVGGNCPGGDDSIAPLTYFHGTPADGFTPVRLVLDNLIEVQPGANQVDITIGQAILSGSITGNGEGICGPIVVGTSDLATIDGPATFALPFEERGPDWVLPVHPGEYLVTIHCSAFTDTISSVSAGLETWPGVTAIAEAQVVRVANGEVRSDLDIDLSSTYDPTTGSLINFFFEDFEEDTPVCIESYDIDGTLLWNLPGGTFYETVIADDGEYRIRITDCFGYGFRDEWYPAGSTRTTGPTITVDGALDILLDALPLVDAPVQPPVAPGVPTCDGLAVTVDLSAGDRPTAGPDVILGTEGDDIINGGNGADTICGLGGNDIINAGQGRDTVLAGAGDDFVSGGKGKDTIIGGLGDDDLRGNEGTDRLDGGNGSDELRGGQKADVLIGGNGNDNLVGGTRPDILDGGQGTDSFNGGGGADTCALDPDGRSEVRDRCEFS